jgi:hypothetical protein
LVTLTLTPQAVKTWLAQPEASLSFAYTNHAPAIIRVLPALEDDADAGAEEEEEEE